MKWEVDKVARNELFEQVKFLSVSELASNGSVSMFVKKQIAGGNMDTSNWSGTWEEWAKKAVKRQINNRRNTVCLAVGVEAMARKLSDQCV